MRRARDCGDSIAAGAVASAGGLSTNLREWAAVEDEDASFVKVSDVPWMVAMEAGREERERGKAKLHQIERLHRLPPLHPHRFFIIRHHSKFATKRRRN